MRLRDLFDRLVNRPTAAAPVTTIEEATFDIPPRGHFVTELTEETIRMDEGESWQPPAPARRDPWRPSSDHW